MKTTTIQKWGNSYAVRLPKRAVERLRLAEGRPVSIVEREGENTLRIVPLKQNHRSRRPTLKNLLRNVRPHAGTEVQAWQNMQPVGKEAW